LKLWSLLKIEDSMDRWIVSPFELYRWEGEDFKTYGIKARCYWEHPWGTRWEHDGNPLGTNEQRKKNPPPPWQPMTNSI
jgi:hypothetical protein